jgi:hypothetical protein
MPSTALDSYTYTAQRYTDAYSAEYVHEYGYVYEYTEAAGGSA